MYINEWISQLPTTYKVTMGLDYHVSNTTRRISVRDAFGGYWKAGEFDFDEIIEIMGWSKHDRIIAETLDGAFLITISYNGGDPKHSERKIKDPEDFDKREKCKRFKKPRRSNRSKRSNRSRCTGKVKKNRFLRRFATGPKWQTKYIDFGRKIFRDSKYTLEEQSEMSGRPIIEQMITNSTCYIDEHGEFVTTSETKPWRRLAYPYEMEEIERSKYLKSDLPEPIERHEVQQIDVTLKNTEDLFESKYTITKDDAGSEEAMIQKLKDLVASKDDVEPKFQQNQVGDSQNRTHLFQVC